MPPVGAHHRRRELGALPEIVVPRFGDGHVEPVMHPVLQTLHDRALILERLARRQMQLPHHHAHDHDSVALRERATSSIRYDSIRSLTFTSLKRVSDDSVPS